MPSEWRFSKATATSHQNNQPSEDIGHDRGDIKNKSHDIKKRKRTTTTTNLKINNINNGTNSNYDDDINNKEDNNYNDDNDEYDEQYMSDVNVVSGVDIDIDVDADVDFENQELK